MSVRLVWPACVLTGLSLLALATVNPRLGLMAVVGIGALVVGVRAPSVPIAFAVGSTLAAVILANSLPKGGTVALYTAWIFGSLAIMILLRGRGSVHVRDIIDVPFVATVVLTTLIVGRIAAWPAHDYGSQKAQLVVIQLLLPYAAMSIVATSERETVRFFRVLLALDIAAAFYAAAQLATGNLQAYASDRLTLSSAVNPIGLARDMGATVLLVLFFAARAGSLRARLLLTACAGPALATMLASGSRAPVIALMFSTPLLLFLRSGNRVALRRMGRTLAVLGGIGVVGVIAVVPAASLTRILSAFGGDSVQYGSDPHRSVLWDEALKAAPDHLFFGTGTGGFAGIDGYGLLYPHNIFLETLVEQGIVGLVLLLVVVVAAIVKLGGFAVSRRPGSEWVALATTLVVFGLVNAFFSGDISTNSTIWIWIGAGSGIIAGVRRGTWARGPIADPVDGLSDERALSPAR